MNKSLIHHSPFKKHFSTSRKFMKNGKILTLPLRIEIFSPINNLVKNDTFKSITYQGVFDRRGRKAHIIEAETAEYMNVAMAFDVETKLLISYIQQFYGISYADYL